MSHLTENDWRGLFRDALMDSDLTTATAAQEAYKAIQHRMLALSAARSPETKERNELNAAIYFLRLLKGVVPLETANPRNGAAL